MIIDDAYAYASLTDPETLAAPDGAVFLMI